MPSSAFVVFARAPVAGQVKTRLFRADPAVARAALGRTLSAEDAACLHAAFVSDVLRKGQRCGFGDRWLYSADAAEHATLSGLARDYGYTCRVQRGADLGVRMASAFTDLLAPSAPSAAVGPSSAATSVILVGTDSPTLPIAYLQQADAALAAGHDVVLGPACDGGYYLIGLRRPLLDLFPPDMPWGTADVLSRTLDRLARLATQGLRSHLLPFFYDCDTPHDVRLLRQHLRWATARPGHSPQDSSQDVDSPATQAALKQLGLWGMD